MSFVLLPINHSNYLFAHEPIDTVFTDAHPRQSAATWNAIFLWVYSPLGGVCKHLWRIYYQQFIYFFGTHLETNSAWNVSHMSLIVVSFLSCVQVPGNKPAHVELKIPPKLLWNIRTMPVRMSYITQCGCFTGLYIATLPDLPPVTTEARSARKHSKCERVKAKRKGSHQFSNPPGNREIPESRHSDGHRC